MKNSSPNFIGVITKPKPGEKGIHYYVETVEGKRHYFNTLINANRCRDGLRRDGLDCDTIVELPK